MTGAPIREWSDAELRRMQSVVESGTVKLEEVGRRFRCSRHTVVALIRRLGWHNPHAEQTAKYVGRPPKPKRGTFFNPNRPAFEPKENGCPVRTLTGAELEYWKSIYEARDQAERAKAHGVTA